MLFRNQPTATPIVHRRRPRRDVEVSLSKLLRRMPGAMLIPSFDLPSTAEWSSPAWSRPRRRPDIMVVVGGVVPPQDYEALKAAGAATFHVGCKHRP